MKNELVVGRICSDFAHEIEMGNFVESQNGQKTVELIAQRFTLDPKKPILEFGDIRKTQISYCKHELEWYLSQDLHIKKIGKYAKIWRDVAASDGTVNSNYGWAIFSDENYNQFDHCLNELRENPESRRGVMIYNRPKMWYDYNRDGMSDFMCTFATQHMIRDYGYGPRLVSIVNMRSNDLIYGFFNDFYWQCWVHSYLLTKLQNTPNNKFLSDLKSGKMIWIANSLHVYERHFDMVKKMSDWYIKENDELMKRNIKQLQQGG